MHLAEECYTSNSRSIHEVYNFSEVQQGNFWYGEEESDLVILGLQKKVGKTKKKLLETSHCNSAHILFSYQWYTWGRTSLTTISFIRLPIEDAMKAWQMRFCFQKLANMEPCPLKYFSSFFVKKTQLDKKFVSYLNSHSTLHLLTTNFKLSSVASNCGISILPKRRGEDNEGSGKLDLHVYFNSQFSSLC